MPNSKPPQQIMKKVAIVLITKDRRKLFYQTFKSLIDNTHRDLYDLIVVDDDSTKTSLLADLLNRGEITDLIFTDMKSPGACRNIGMEIVKRRDYEYVYHTDNDMYFLPGWLEKCIDALEKYPEIGLIAPYGHPYHLQNDDPLYSLPANGEIYPVNACAGNSWFLRVKDYVRIGLAENKGIMASEDHDFCIKMRYPIDFNKDYGPEKLCCRFRENMVLHCGITNSKGEPATGADVMLEELSEAKIKHNLNIYYE